MNIFQVYHLGLNVFFPFQAKRPKTKVTVTHQQKISDVLETTKTRQTVHEASLGEVLYDPDKYDGMFEDADLLLHQVRTKLIMVQRRFYACGWL